MSRNILIFSDGTGQAGGLTPDENVSNIYKLFRATRCGPESDIDPSEQLTFYDRGLGSQPDTGVFSAERAYRWLHNAVSRATGLGITMNIIDCYAAILRMWQPGDLFDRDFEVLPSPASGGRQRRLDLLFADEGVGMPLSEREQLLAKRAPVGLFRHGPSPAG